MKIKAAGGIADLKDAEDFINLGASRLGTSRIVKAVKAWKRNKEEMKAWELPITRRPRGPLPRPF